MGKYLPEEKEAKGKPICPYTDLTKEFFDFLKLPKKEVFKRRLQLEQYLKKKRFAHLTAKEKEEMISKQTRSIRTKQIGIIIAGGVGVGKSTLAERIAYELKEYWKSKGYDCNIVKSTASTEALTNWAFKGNPEEGWNAKKPIQILIFDDETSVPLSAKTANAFFRQRHRMAKATGLKEGVIYSILICHDWYRLDPSFRRGATGTVFLTIPTLDQYSRRVYRKFVNQEKDKKDRGLKYLETLSPLKMRSDVYKKYGIVNFGGKVGGITFEPKYLEYFEVKERGYLKVPRNYRGRGPTTIARNQIVTRLEERIKELEKRPWHKLKKNWRKTKEFKVSKKRTIGLVFLVFLLGTMLGFSFAPRQEITQTTIVIDSMTSTKVDLEEYGFSRSNTSVIFEMEIDTVKEWAGLFSKENMTIEMLSTHKLEYILKEENRSGKIWYALKGYSTGSTAKGIFLLDLGNETNVYYTGKGVFAEARFSFYEAWTNGTTWIQGLKKKTVMPYTLGTGLSPDSISWSLNRIEIKL